MITKPVNNFFEIYKINTTAVSYDGSIARERCENLMMVRKLHIISHKKSQHFLYTTNLNLLNSHMYVSLI